MHHYCILYSLFLQPLCEGQGNVTERKREREKKKKRDFAKSHDPIPSDAFLLYKKTQHVLAS